MLWTGVCLSEVVSFVETNEWIDVFRHMSYPRRVFAKVRLFEHLQKLYTSLRNLLPLRVHTGLLHVC